MSEDPQENEVSIRIIRINKGDEKKEVGHPQSEFPKYVPLKSIFPIADRDIPFTIYNGDVLSITAYVLEQDDGMVQLEVLNVGKGRLP